MLCHPVVDHDQRSVASECLKLVSLSDRVYGKRLLLNGNYIDATMALPEKLFQLHMWPT